MSNDFLLLGHARSGGTRVKNKMTRKFHDTTLFDLYLKKFYNITVMDNPFSKIRMALYKEDEPLYSIAKESGVIITDRDESSITNNPNIDCVSLFHYLKDFDEKYVVWVNGCFPFLKEKTIIDITNYFKDNDLKSLHCVVERQNWFWDSHKKLPINVNPFVLATQSQKTIYESVHCLHIFDRKYMLDSNRMFPYEMNNPYLYELEDTFEFLDIDTMKDFEICEALYARRS